MNEPQPSNEDEDLREQLERTRAEMESEIHAFFDRATVGAAQVGLDGRFISVNDRYCEILGFSREEILSGITPLDLIPAEERDEVRNRLMPFLRGEIPEYNIEHHHTRKDGAEIWVHVTAGMIRDHDGRPMRIAAIIEDITARRRAEEALHRSRRELEQVNQTLEQRITERTAEVEARAAQLRKLAGELTRTEQRERRRFAQMLHDHLQQLLVGAKFNASIIERRLGDDATRRHLQYVSDLLDQAIAASRTLTIELSPPILFEGKLVPALHWLARWMEENHGLHLTVTADDEVFPLGEDMRILLFQSVRELVFNVVKHAGVSEALINVTRHDSMLHIVIEDHGAGFDSESLNPADFSGFGLLKVKERLNLLGGCFDLVSVPGTGTRVTLVAPLQHAEPGAQPGEPSGKRIRVLIADDHALIRDGLSQVLQADPGVEVVGTAADGLQAVELADSLHPDVVLMDVSMPKLSGIEATRRLRRHMHASIIGLSMHSETEMAVRMREAGAVDYIVKTASPEEVLAAIRHAYEAIA